MLNNKSSSSIFADQQHWPAGESSMGARATTTSSQVSEEQLLAVCLVRLVHAGTVTCAGEQTLPESPCRALVWACLSQAKTETLCPLPSPKPQESEAEELWEACRQVRHPKGFRVTFPKHIGWE